MWRKVEKVRIGIFGFGKAAYTYAKRLKEECKGWFLESTLAEEDYANFSQLEKVPLVNGQRPQTYCFRVYDAENSLVAIFAYTEKSRYIVFDRDLKRDKGIGLMDVASGVIAVAVLSAVIAAFLEYVVFSIGYWLWVAICLIPVGIIAFLARYNGSSLQSSSLRHRNADYGNYYYDDRVNDSNPYGEDEFLVLDDGRVIETEYEK